MVLKIKRLKTRAYHLWKQKIGRACVCGTAALLAAILLVAGLVSFISPTRAEPANEVLFNIPYTYIPPRSISDLDWTFGEDGIDDHKGFDIAYTEAISQKYNNGKIQEEHADITGDTLTFFGYWKDPYMDYFFTDAYPALIGFNFMMRPMQMIFHTFYQTGFLFNGMMTEEGGKTYYTGYGLILECSNSEGMLTTGEANLKLYYIEKEEWEDGKFKCANPLLCEHCEGEATECPLDEYRHIYGELWDTEEFRPGGLHTRTLIATLKSGIENFSTEPFHVSLDIDPATRAFRLYVDGELRARVAAGELQNGADSVGFGFFTGYYFHSCDIITIIRYENISLEFASLTPPEDTATVRFLLDSGVETVLRPDETLQGYTNLQYYRIEQPPEIEYLGETYYLVHNSREPEFSIDRDITLRYVSTAVNKNANTTILYYSKDPPDTIGNRPRKTASVEGGEWDTGTQEMPVPVDANYNLTYNIISGAKPLPPDSGLPVLTPGNTDGAATSGWMKQPLDSRPITKQQVITLNTVSLDTNYPAVEDFRAAVPYWRGEPVVKAWDATVYVPTAPPATGVTQYKTNIATGTYTNATIIPYLDGLNVPGMTINGAISSNPYSGSSTVQDDNLVIYRIPLGGQGAPNMITWNGGRDSSDNIVLLYTDGHWEQIGAVTSGGSGNYSVHNWKLTAQQRQGITDANMHIAFFSVKTGSYSGIYNATTNPAPFTLEYGESDAISAYIWATERPESTPVNRKYNLYIGGKGGVQLSANAAYQFYSFSAMTTANLKYLHTDRATNMTGMFSSCAALTSLDCSGFYTANVANMSSMFSNCSNLASLDVKYFDTQNVTNMSSMFSSCSKLAALDLRGWDTAKVTSMSQMFYFCNVLGSLDLRSFDTSNVNNMSYMFGYCYALASLDVSTFDTAKVTSMSYMFNYCQSLASLDVRHFNTSKVTSMNSMFASCSKLTSLDLSSFDTTCFDTVSNTGLTSLDSMFSGCTLLASLDISTFDTKHITAFSSMFYGCSSLPSLNLSHFDTSSANTLYRMFYGCSGMASLDVSNFDTSKVINMNETFRGMSGLSALDLSSFVTAQAKTMQGLFYGCSNLTALDLSRFDTSQVTGKSTSLSSAIAATPVALETVPEAEMRVFSGMSYMFYGCSKLAALDLSRFDTSKVGTMRYMFYGCYGLANLDLRTFDTSKVENMSYMFYNCNQFDETKLDISRFNTSKVDNMSYMFGSCSGFKTNSFDAFLTHFDTRAVTDMSGMFASCSGITSIDLRAFNTTVPGPPVTSNLTTMAYMFSSCTKLEQVNLSSFDTSKVGSFAGLFSGCSALLSPTLDLSTLDTSACTDFSAMFNGCGALTSLDLSTFNTVNGRSFANMFSSCGKLASLDLKSFNTANATDFSFMFYNSPQLASIDMSTFVTANVANFNYMFANCTALTSLDLSNFDTPSATNLSYMFNSCSGLGSLPGTGLTGISHFNTEKVTNMNSVFNGCRNLAEIDIRWWKTPLVTNAYSMFTPASVSNQLRRVYMQSMDLTHIDPLTPPIYSGSNTVITNMFNYVLGPAGAGMDVYFGSTEMVEWFDDARPKINIPPATDYTVNINPVLAGSPGANPGPAGPAPRVFSPLEPLSACTYAAPLPPLSPTTPAAPSPITPPGTPAAPVVRSCASNPVKRVTDTIPPGLTILSVSGGLSYTVNGQEIEWIVDSFCFDLFVEVTVDPAEEADYVNSASLFIDLTKIDDTNDTYHVYGMYYLVTEQYYVFDSGGAHTRLAPNNEFNGGRPVRVDEGDDFARNPAHIPGTLYGQYYYGYQYLDGNDDPDMADPGGIHQGLPPDPIFGDVRADKLFRYYYRTFPCAVYIHFVDEAGNEIQQTVEWPMNLGGNYELPERYLDSITAGPVTWNYYGYKLKDPDTDAHAVRGSQPDRTILQLAPQFPNIQGDKHITLYFSQDPIVTVYFLDYLQRGNVLRDSETYFIDAGSFTPDQALFENITSAGNDYEYVEKWSRDGGALQDGEPGTLAVASNTEIELYFTTYYTITERFHTIDEPRFEECTDGCGNNANHPRLDPVKLSPDVFQGHVPAGTPYAGAPPTVIVDGEDNVWGYVGYKIGDDAAALYSGVPQVPGINDHLHFIFVYELRPDLPAVKKASSVSQEVSLLPGEEFTYTISVQYPPASGAYPTGTVRFSDLLPEGIVFVGSAPAASTADEGGRTRVTAQATLSDGYAQLAITVRVDESAQEAWFYNFADVTGHNGKVFRTNTVKNHSGVALDPVTASKASVPPSGDENTPAAAAVNSQIVYTVTVDNGNGGRSAPAVVTDVLPRGLAFVSAGDGGTYNPTTRTVTWNVASLPEGLSTYTFTARVTSLGVIKNTAAVKVPGQPAATTNATWHAAQLAPPVKTSCVSADGGTSWGDTDDNFTEAKAVPVKPGDHIQYSIVVNNPGDKVELAPDMYDVLFVVDWSGSMRALLETYGDIGYMDDEDDGVAIEYAAGIIRDMCGHIFENYPGSRFALLGMNTNPLYDMANYYDPAYAYVQFETDFGTDTSVVADIFGANADSEYAGDDVAIFLGAATAKMQGLTPSFGGNGTGTLASSIAYPRADQSRTPVIVLISDFQINIGPGSWNNSGTDYWANCLGARADDFADAFDDGILMTLRMDTRRNMFEPEQFGSAVFDELMAEHVAPYKSGSAVHGSTARYDAGWRFVKAAYNDPYAVTVERFMDTFTEIAPPGVVAATVVDVVPEGLEIIGTTPQAIVSGQSVKWFLDELPAGQSVFTIEAVVQEPGAYDVYANSATAQVTVMDPVPTNTTWHNLRNQNVLHIRQVVVGPLDDLQLPVMGYYLLQNGAVTLPLTSDSTTPGYLFTDYILQAGDNDLYLLTDIVPQYYEFLGHFQNGGDTAAVGHDIPTIWDSPKNGLIKLDYSETGEIWVTVYITPRGAPGKNQTGVETNRFGTVYH